MQELINNLKKPDVSVCFKTPDGVITAFSGNGLKPLLKAVRQLKDKLNGASAADKTIGKAAALIMVYAKVKEIYASVLSDSGARVLEKYGIKYSAAVRVTFIENRDKTGICPMEAKSQTLTTPEEAFRLFSELITE